MTLISKARSRRLSVRQLGSVIAGAAAKRIRGRAAPIRTPQVEIPGAPGCPTQAFEERGLERVTTIITIIFNAFLLTRISLLNSCAPSSSPRMRTLGSESKDIADYGKVPDLFPCSPSVANELDSEFRQFNN